MGDAVADIWYGNEAGAVVVFVLSALVVVAFV